VDSRTCSGSRFPRKEAYGFMAERLSWRELQTKSATAINQLQLERQLLIKDEDRSRNHRGPQAALVADC
jgi:hypothetical protein